jgi:1,4-alpha-glucan branching enzyme
MAAQRGAARIKSEPKQRVTFHLDDPQASSVAVAGCFNGWDAEPTALKKDKSGAWKVTLWMKPGRYEYRFLVDGQWRNDPACGECVANSFGSENCVLHVQPAAEPAMV